MSTAIIVIIIVVLFFCILCCSLISSAAGIMNSSNSSNTTSKPILLTGEWYYKGFPDKKVEIIDNIATVTVNEEDSAQKRIQTTFRVETRNAIKFVAISSENNQNLIMESLDYKNLKIYSMLDTQKPSLELIREQ